MFLGYLPVWRCVTWNIHCLMVWSYGSLSTTNFQYLIDLIRNCWYTVMLMKVWSSLNAVLCWYFVTLILQLNYITLQKVTTGQRMTESSVLDAHCTEVSSDHYYHTWRPVFLVFGVDMHQYILKTICRLMENRTGIMSI